MNEPPPRSDDDLANPFEDGDEKSKPNRPTLRWFHLLAFFLPAAIVVTTGSQGLKTMAEWGPSGLTFGGLLCLVNGIWLAHLCEEKRRLLGGIVWTIAGLILNTALAFAGCAFAGLMAK